MNLTHCPVCNTRVLSTHRCQGRLIPLVPIPDNFRELVDQARAEQAEAEQLDLLAAPVHAPEGSMARLQGRTP